MILSTAKLIPLTQEANSPFLQQNAKIKQTIAGVVRIAAAKMLGQTRIASTHVDTVADAKALCMHAYEIRHNML